MIKAFARLIGLTLLGQFLDRLPPLVGAWLRVALALVVFGLPIIAVSTGAATYTDLWWWLWIDACVVGIWAMVMLRARGESPWFLFTHYFLMFTVLPGVLMAWLLVRDVPLTQTPWFLVVMGLASFVVHGWVTRRLWWRWPKKFLPSRKLLTQLFLSNYVYPYLRLAVVYAGMFIPLAIPGIPQDDPRPVDLSAAADMAVVLAVVKLSLEVLLALIHAVGATARNFEGAKTAT